MFNRLPHIFNKLISAYVSSAALSGCQLQLFTPSNVIATQLQASFGHVNHSCVLSATFISRECHTSTQVTSESTEGPTQARLLVEENADHTYLHTYLHTYTHIHHSMPQQHAPLLETYSTAVCLVLHACHQLGGHSGYRGHLRRSKTCRCLSMYDNNSY